MSGVFLILLFPITVLAQSDAVAIICFITQFCVASIREPKQHIPKNEVRETIYIYIPNDRISIINHTLPSTIR